MGTVQMMRTVLGIFLILLGLGLYAYDEQNYINHLAMKYSPICWLLFIIIGVLLLAFNIESGIYFAIAVTMLWSIEKVVLVELDEKKNEIKESL